MGIGPKGGLGDQGDAVSRQLILTKVSLVERRPENYEVATILPCFLLNVVQTKMSIVVVMYSLDFPRMFFG